MKNYVLAPGAIVIALAIVCCTKKVARNTALAYDDQALLDSCKLSAKLYYKNDPWLLLSGSKGPHGAYRLRFNSVAAQVLTENGQLPAGKTFPDGSLVVKDVYSGSDISIYALMYKVSGSWLWAEIQPNGSVHYSVKKDPSVCISCHGQPGNRDLLLTFDAY